MKKTKPEHFIRMLRRAVVGASALTLLAAPGLEAQEAEEGSQQELMAELREVNQELANLRTQAMQDEELQQQQAEVQATVVSAMKEADPQTEQKMQRLTEIQQSLQQAQQEENPEEVGSLIQEQRSIQQSLQQAQVEAMQQPEVAEAVESFRSDLIAAMKEIDPEAEELVRRQEEIQAELTGSSG